MEPLAVDVREAARLTSLSVFTIRRYIRRGILPAIRVGRRVIVPTEALRMLIREGGSPNPQATAECTMVRSLRKPATLRRGDQASSQESTPGSTSSV